MEILGIGPMELMLIAALALILMGPKDMAKAGKTIGKWLNDFIHSDTWLVLKETSKTVRNLPTQLIREANFEEAQKNRHANPALPKYEEMDAIAKAPEEFRAPRPATPEEDALEPNAILPPRAQPFVPGQPVTAPKPTTSTRASAQTKARAVRKPASAPAGKSSKSSKTIKTGKSAPTAKTGTTKPKRGKKADA